MLFDISLDLKTLFVSSTLSRGAFLLVFLVLLIGQKNVRYMRHWTAALVASTAGLSITIEYANRPELPLPIAFVSYSMLLGSLVSSWTGLRLFYGRKIRLVVIPLLAVVPSALYVLGASLNLTERILLPIIYAAAALPAGLALYEILRGSRLKLLTPYIVAAAFATYFLALVIPGLLILIALLPPTINTSSLPSILFDQASSILVYFGYIAMSSERATFDLREQANTDPLTRVTNRRGGEPLLEDAYRRRLSGHSCSVILADVDHFKTVNDTWGHDAGDLVLTGVAERLTTCLRRGDILVRWGGEEFLIILPNTSLLEAKFSANRLRERVADTPFCVKQAELRVTLSLGCSELVSDDLSYEASLQRADKALYLAKSIGRNQVC